MNSKLAGRYKGWASLCAVVGALLVVAAPAAAEVRTGQETSAAEPGIPGQADLVGAAATYDSSAGTVTITATTREATIPTVHTLTQGFFGVFQGNECELPWLSIAGVSFASEPRWFTAENAEQLEEIDAEEGIHGEPASQSTSGAATTLSASSTSLIGRPYNCADVLTAYETADSGGAVFGDEIVFPLSAVQTPPSSPSPPSNPAPPAPAPAALAIGKTKTVKAAAGRWTKVKVTVTNPGGSATGAVALKVKAPKGVELKPGSGKVRLAPLRPGKAETAIFKVEPARRAKSKSTLALTATAPGLSARGTLVVKRVG